MIDLHCHTRYSDGSASLQDVLEMASRRGVQVLAITDHDTMAGCAPAVEMGKKLGIQIVPGVEISTKDPERGRKVHILCYAPKYPEVLEPLLSATLSSRMSAAREAMEVVSSLYPVTAAMIRRHAEGSTCVYKQHMMYALMDAGCADTIFGETFRSLFNSKTGPAYRSVQYPDVYTALDTVHKAGGKAVLAHPSEYNSMDLLESLCEQNLLDGIEVYHPRNREEDREKMLRLAAEYDLAVTGGTDFHGFYTTRKNPVGTCTTAQAEFDRLFDHERK